MARRMQAKKTTIRKRYSKEFRDEALALAERLGVAAAAKDLGLHDSQIYGWRAKARAEQNQSETERNQAVEIARLKRKVAEQAEELAVVKKAAAYFAKSLK
jgi:transposase